MQIDRKSAKRIFLSFIIIIVVTVTVNCVDYWAWLGYPSPLNIFHNYENYPGHNLTSQYKHVDYFENIPIKYGGLLEQFGIPTQIERFEYDAIKEIKIIYENFYITYRGDKLETEEGYKRDNKLYITGDGSTLFDIDIAIGDSKEKIEKQYKYFEVDENENSKYRDGSMLTGIYWIHFEYDLFDRVSKITIEKYSEI